MLGRLIKYELRATGRVMLPLFAILIVASAALGLNIRYLMDQDRFGILSLMIVFLFVAAVLVVSVVSVILVMQRFYKNLLGDEGYLMFSLPVRTGENILSKLLTALIWTVASMVVGAVSGIVLVRIVGEWNSFLDELSTVWKMMTSQGQTGTAIHYLILALVVLILSMMETVMKVYAAISVGHQWSNHRIIGSALGYLAFSVIETVLTYALNVRDGIRTIMIDTVGEAEQEGLFLTNIGLGFGSLRMLLVVSLAGIVIYGFITWYLLDHRLNLE